MKQFPLTRTLRMALGLTALWLLSACAPQSHMTQFAAGRAVPAKASAPNHLKKFNDLQKDGDISSPESSESFDVADIASDTQLDSSRGGFLFAGGLTINFGLISSTTINGIIQSSLNLSTTSLQGGLPANIQQLVQTANAQTSGVNTAPSSISNVSNISNVSTVSNNVRTIVQNSANGATIQTQNVLNLTVQNLHNFSSQINIANQRVPQTLFIH